MRYRSPPAGKRIPTATTLDGFFDVFADEVLSVARAAVGDDGEFLELRDAKDGRSYWLLNVTTTADALDEEHSEVERFTSGRIMDVTRHSFRADVIADVRVFRIPQLSGTVYFTSTAVDRLRAGGLEGLVFNEVWSNGSQLDA